LTAARFPTCKTLKNLDFRAQPSLNRALVSELTRCLWIEQRETVLLVGTSGAGKTHVAAALAVEACSRGKRVRFYRVTEPITPPLEAREERELGRFK